MTEDIREYAGLAAACLSKIPYKTWEDAYRAVLNSGYSNCEPYFCRCGNYHIGHRERDDGERDFEKRILQAKLRRKKYRRKYTKWFRQQRRKRERTVHG